MITVSLTGNVIRVTYMTINADKTEMVNKVVPYTKARYERILEIKKEASSLPRTDFKNAYLNILNELDGILTLTIEDQIQNISDDLVINDKGQVFLKHKGNVIMVPMPELFVSWIRERIDREEDIQPIIKFWIRLLRNPNCHKSVKKRNQFIHELCHYIMMTYSDASLYAKFKEEGYSDAMADEMSQVLQVPLTDEGLMHTQKVVDVHDSTFKEWVLMDGIPTPVIKEEYNVDPINGKLTEPPSAEAWNFYPPIMGSGGDDWYLDGMPNMHIYKIGSRAMLESWDQVSTNDNPRKGFWLGNRNWVEGYEKQHNATLNVFVCPSQVGCVAHWRNWSGALVVKEFFAHSIKNREMENRNFYTSSSYGAQLDNEWNQQKDELIKQYDTEKEEFMKKWSDRRSAII